MVQAKIRKWENVSSLKSLAVSYTVANLSNLPNNSINYVKLLPNHIKNDIIKTLLSSSYYWHNIDLKFVLRLVVNKDTEHIDLTNTDVDDEILKILRICTNLKELYLSHYTDFCSSQELIQTFASIKKLQMLRISKCPSLNEEVVTALCKSCQDLQGVDFGGCTNFTDESLTSLSELKYLQWVNISRTPVTEKGIKLLVEGPSAINLKELRISECKNIVDQSIFCTITENCPKMEVLFFCKKLDEQGDSNFNYVEGGLKNLKQLYWTIKW